MLAAFPTPVLSIAADAVKDLEGRDALLGLWALFTKCKESLQDGRRLENISWRLWYREMMQDGLTNRLSQGNENENEKEEPDHALKPHGPHTPTNLYRPPTPSESTPPPPFVVQDSNGLNDLTLSNQPSVLLQDHDHTSSSPTSRLGPTQVNMFRSNSSADPALCPPLDSASASLQMSKSKLNSDPVLSPVVPAHPFSLSSSSSGSKSRDFTDVPTRVSSDQSTQIRLSGFPAQIQCHAGSNTPPVRVGRIIYDMLPRSASNENETSISWLKVWPSSMTTTTRKSSSVESIPTPAVDPSSSLQLLALAPTISEELPNSIEPTSATMNAGAINPRYTFLPPSPSLSDSYARAHPGEVGVQDVTRLDVAVGLGPSLSVSEPSPSSPQILGNAHIFGLSPNLQVPPRLVVVNPTPNLTPHPTPPASPVCASSASASTSHSNNPNGFGGSNGNWLTLPPNHYSNRIQDPQTHDRSRSDSVPTTATDINFVSSSSFSPPPPHHQSVDEDQLLTSQSFVQELETSANSNSNRHSISSTTTIASATDSTASAAISTATAATSVFLDEASEVDEAMKTMKDGDMWINDAPVVGSPVDNIDAQLLSKAGGSGPSLRLRLDSLSTIHSMSVRKDEDEDEDSDDDLEELDEATRLMNATTTTAAAATKKKKIGIRKKVKTKTKPSKRNSLRSPTSTLSPPLSAALHQPTFSSSMNQKQGTVMSAPHMARPASNGRSSSRSMSQSGRSSYDVRFGSNGSASRSRSREIHGASLGMTSLNRVSSSEGRKTVIAASTKFKYRPKFMMAKNKGSSSGKTVGSGSTMIRRESSGGNPGGSGQGGMEGNGDNDRERERGRERMIAMEIIQMQRRQQLLIQQQQQQQLEMKQREDEQRALVAQLARQDADVHEAEIRKQRQRLHHEQRQEQGVPREKDGLLGVTSKRPVMFNIESNSEGSGLSNSANGSGVSGPERLIPLQQEGDIREPHQLEIIQQQHTVAPHHYPAPHHRPAHHHPAPHHPAPHNHPASHHHQQLKSEKQLERQIIREGEEVAERQLQKEEKKKGREHSNPNPNTKHSTHETLNMVSSALAAKVKHTLADPLLPGQHKRTIVLTTSESEYEHSDDDGSWSSEEMGSEDEEEGRRQERQRQDRLLAQQQQLQQLQQRRSPVHRTRSSNHALTANHNHNHTHAANQRTQSSRGHRQTPNHAQGQALAQAAHEAQRQRDMFAKKPTESFQNLTQVARTQSVGLLTQLLNPDPEIFPVGHPYRRGYSSSEIKGVGGRASASRGDRDRDRGFKPLQPLMDVKATKTDNTQDNTLETRPPPSHPEVTVHRKSSSTAALSPPARTISMQRTKSTVAMPVSSQVQTGSMSHTSNAVEGGGHGAVDGFGMTNMKMIVNSNYSSGGYRPKGRPQDQELEDESGSEAEFGIQLSKSVAQEKLKALAERRGIIAHGNQSTTTTNGGGEDINPKNQLGDEGDVPHWAKVSRPRPPTRTHSHDQYPQSQAPDPNANRRSLNAFHFSQMITSTPSHATPIPVGHPYNLPPPAPPSTPRTTRRLMLSTELSESLRRNLLWERQVSKVNLAAAVRRTASSGGSRPSHLGGVQPLTTPPSMVQLLPKGTLTYPNPGSPERPEQGGSKGDGGMKKERRASGGDGDHPGPSVHDENEKEQKRRLAMARNRSWANDYHFAGW